MSVVHIVELGVLVPRAAARTLPAQLSAPVGISMCACIVGGVSALCVCSMSPDSIRVVSEHVDAVWREKRATCVAQVGELRDVGQHVRADGHRMVLEMACRTRECVRA